MTKRIVLILAIALIGGCSAQAATPTIAPATPAPITAAPATLEPTPSPTVRAEVPSWTAFKAHETAFQATLNADMATYNDAIETSNDIELWGAAKKIGPEAGQERVWLNANQPDACYRSVWTDTYEGFGWVVDAMTAVGKLEYTDANGYMAKAATKLKSASDETDAAEAACAL